MKSNINVGGIWRHKKTQGLYKVVAIGKIEATLEDCVVYESLKDGVTWVRPLLEFCDGRFKKVEVWDSSMIPPETDPNFLTPMSLQLPL